TKASDNADQARKETEPVKNYILLPLWTANPPFSQDPKSSQDDGCNPSSDDGKKVDEDLRKDSEGIDQEKEDNVNSTNNVNAASTNEVNAVGGKTSIELPLDLNMPKLEDYSIFDSSRNDEDDCAEADMNNLDTTIQVSPNLTTRIHKDHPLDQVIGDLQSAIQTRKMSKNLEEHGKNPKRNKKDERGIVIRNKARLVAQGCTQEEGIDYDEVFSPVAIIEAIRLFLAYASFKDFVVYQMDVKSAFLYGKMEEEVNVCQPPGFEDPNFLDRVYKVAVRHAVSLRLLKLIDLDLLLKIIMVNEIPPDYVDNVPVVPEPIMEDEDEDPEEDEFEEEKDPQEEEYDMEVDIEEDENEPELTYPYEEDNDSFFGQMVNFSRRLCGRETAHALVEKKGKAKDTFYGKLILDLGNEVRSSVEQGTTVMEKLIEMLGNTEDKVEFRAHKFYQEMIRRGFVFEARPNEAINVPIEDDKSPLSEPRGSPHNAYCQSCLQVLQPIDSNANAHEDQKESVDAAIAAERARQANVRNNASGSGPVRGAVELRRWFKKTKNVFEISECAEYKKVKFVAATLEGPFLTWWKTKVVTMGLETVNQMPCTEMKQLMTAEFCPIEEVQRMEHELWNLKVKEYDVVANTQRFNELALMCPRMVEPERVKVDAYIRGLTDNIKARDARILEGKKRKWENLQSRNSSGKGNQRDNSRHTLQNSQKQGNARAMVTAPTDGKLPLCERYFTRHVGQCTIKCHKCGKVGHKQGHTRNRCPKRIKQEEVGEVRGRAYAIKDAEPQGPNVVTGTFLLNNQYASILFDSGSDRSFVNTRFSSLLDIKLIKIEYSYEVELDDGRIVSTNIVFKGCTLSLVNNVFEIDLMPIELGTFDVIISMDLLVKHDVVFICGVKVVRISYGNKTLIVEGDKGVSRLKVISCIKARKYVERGCHLFLAHVMENKSKEKRMEDVPIIRDFPKVFPEELPGLPPPRQVEYRIDLVPGATLVARTLYRLAPFEMKELSVQLQELLEKGFIRPSLSPRGAPVLFMKKKDGSFRMCIDCQELLSSSDN
ncbi:putative reverse transcriptase domain-containing protein, partial [Tanacetum coccineum]